MARIKAVGANPETLQDKLAILGIRQAALRDELQRVQISEGVLRSRAGAALVQALSDKARAEIRAQEASWARYRDLQLKRLRPDRRNRLRRLSEQVLVRLGSIGQGLIIARAGLGAPGGDSPLFDAAWYLKENPDVSRSGLPPLVHYLVFGGQEGRSPHPLFDVPFYVEQASDIGATGLTPLAHYARFGAARGLSPHPFFDLKFYTYQAPELAVTGESPVLHYLKVGAARGLSPNRLFHPAYYQQQLDSDEPVSNLLLHYLQKGHLRGLRPHPLFDPAWFRTSYPDVGRQEPVSYYQRHTGEPPLNPGPWFDAAAYLRQRGGKRLARLDPLSDYLAGGAWMINADTLEASAARFAAAFPEAAAQGLTPLEHWAMTAQSGAGTAQALRPQAN